VTARVGLPICDGVGRRISTLKSNTCHVSGEKFSDMDMIYAIHYHIAAHGLPLLPVQCWKDPFMLELWDDRAVQVRPNTGETLAEAHEAEMSALRGKAFQS